MPHLGLRISDALAHRLDELTEARGFQDRSGAVRSLISEASMELADRETVPDRDELLQLLGAKAREGSVVAMKALLEEHRRDGDDSDSSEDPFAEFDELAPRREKRSA